MTKTFEKIKLLYEQGKKGTEIAKILEISEPTVSWHLSKIRPPVRPFSLFPWKEIREKYEAGATVRTLQQEYGVSGGAWHLAVKRGDVIPRKQHRITKEYLGLYLVADRPQTSRTNLKSSLIRFGFLVEQCSECGVGTEWNGKKLVLHLDHINGKSKDNRLENLRLVCPNCHSQTTTYAGRNSKKKK